MFKATITITFQGNTFTSTIISEEAIPEYLIADKAYQLALMFADTQIIAKYGHRASAYTFGKLLADLDYDYEISEE